MSSSLNSPQAFKIMYIYYVSLICNNFEDATRFLRTSIYLILEISAIMLSSFEDLFDYFQRSIYLSDVRIEFVLLFSFFLYFVCLTNVEYLKAKLNVWYWFKRNSTDPLVVIFVGKIEFHIYTDNLYMRRPVLLYIVRTVKCLLKSCFLYSLPHCNHYSSLRLAIAV